MMAARAKVGAKLPPSKPSTAASEIIRFGFGRTTVAAILVASSAKGLVAIIMREKPDDEALIAALKKRFPMAELIHDQKGTTKTIDEIVSFVEEPQHNIAAALDVRGTEFQRRVWAAVLKTALGETVTFSDIARQVGSPGAVRAVGNACSQNPLEFAIPCHRVLRSDGSYSGGSAWGDHRQATIVEREAQFSARSRRTKAKKDPV